MKFYTGVFDIIVTVATPKKIFHLIVISAESHFGVFLSPFWPKIFRCSHEIEEYSYVPRCFWESFNIFSWNFLQAFLVSLSLIFFFSNHLEGDDSVLAGHFGEFFGYFFHEILYSYSRYYSGVTTPKRFFTWSCSLLLLRVICGISSISGELFIISLNFKQLWQLLNLNAFSHHVPLCCGPFGGDILGSFWVCFSMYCENRNIFWWYFVPNLYLMLWWSLSKRLWWSTFLSETFLVNLGAYSWNIM